MLDAAATECRALSLLLVFCFLFFLCPAVEKGAKDSIGDSFGLDRSGGRGDGEGEDEECDTGANAVDSAAVRDDFWDDEEEIAGP